MTVYFVQEPSPNKRQPDLSSAKRFGDIKFVYDFQYPVSQNPDRAYNHARVVLENFDPDTDFIADCGGDKMALGVVTHVLSDWTPINFLRWNRYQGGFYEPSYIGTVDEAVQEV